MTQFLVPVTEGMIEESRQHNAHIEAALGSASASAFDAATMRAEREVGTSWRGLIVRSEQATQRVISGLAGPIGLRTFVPDRVDGVLLHFHGGGWTVGGPDQQDFALGAIADGANLAVISADYRLAPENPFPAGPDDCECAARWLIEHAESEFGTKRLLIGGESAGAHLAALTLLRLRDRLGIASAFSGAIFVVGVFDLAMTPSARAWGERPLVINTPLISWFTENFTPGMSDDQRRSAEVSPLYADLQGLPPALFLAGELDPLIDDSLFMAARWQAAGNDAQLLVYPESGHGFLGLPTDTAITAFGALLDFVRPLLATR